MINVLFLILIEWAVLGKGCHNLKHHNSSISLCPNTIWDCEESFVKSLSRFFRMWDRSRYPNCQIVGHMCVHYPCFQRVNSWGRQPVSCFSPLWLLVSHILRENAQTILKDDLIQMSIWPFWEVCILLPHHTYPYSRFLLAATGEAGAYWIPLDTYTCLNYSRGDKNTNHSFPSPTLGTLIYFNTLPVSLESFIFIPLLFHGKPGICPH